VWAHYCLLIYAVSNSGMLPTGCQATAFLIDWIYQEALTSMPSGRPEQEDDSYEPVGQSAGPSPSVSREPAEPLEEQQRQEEVSQMKPKYVLLCLPELLPLGLMALTHTIPFAFVFLWLTLLLMGLVYLAFKGLQVAVRRSTADPLQRIHRQAQAINFLLQMLITTYVHVSVQVMTRVYAGEWRHGGYFDSLWLHLITDADPLAQCPWFSPVRLVDWPLRWT